MRRWFLLVFFAVPAFGQALRPDVSKSFTPAVIIPNQISTLTITLTNPNDVPLTGATIVDHFPAGMAANGAGTTTCGSGLAITIVPGQLSLSGGTIPANGSCTVRAPVTASQVGLYANSTGALFSSGPSSITFGSATLQVVADIPALSLPALLLLAATLAAIGFALLTNRS